MSINWQKTEAALCLLQKKDLHRLIRLTRRELTERWQETEALKERVAGGYRAMANFMAGVTWALACRVALRESKGHQPPGGKRPQSGEMWLPRELLYAVRHQVKARGWHPVTAESASTVLRNLGAECGRLYPADVVPPGPWDPLAAPLAAKAARFVVRMAEGNAAVRVHVDQWFDHGGEA